MTPTSMTRSGALSPGDELIATEPLLLVERDDDTAEHALAVLAPGVEGDRLADPSLTPRLVDVTVQAQHRLVRRDRVAHRGAAHARDDWRPALDHWAELRVELHGLVDGGVLRRHVQVEDRSAGVVQLGDLLVDDLAQVVLVELAGRV